MHRNEITTYLKEDLKIIEVQTTKAKYNHVQWENCSEYQKRKYENLLFLENNTGLPMKFLYK